MHGTRFDLRYKIPEYTCIIFDSRERLFSHVRICLFDG